MATSLLKNSRILLLGGGGLVGSTIAKHLMRLPREVRPQQVLLAALTQEQAERAVQQVLAGQQHQNGSNSKDSPKSRLVKAQQQQQQQPEIVPLWGDIFTRTSLAHQSNLFPQDNPRLCHEQRQMMLEDVHGDLAQAYQRSQLVATLRQYKPDIIVDCINTATVVAYKNIFGANTKLRESVDCLVDHARDTAEQGEELQRQQLDALVQDAQMAMLAQPTPALIRHIQLLSMAAKEIGLHHYIKIGTTGTGGMGMNIPFTHSENKVCPTILAKSMTAFGHSGLLLLWSRTPGAPVIQEIKPAAAIGYRGIDVRQVADRFGNSKIRRFRAVPLNRTTELNLREQDDAWAPPISSTEARKQKYAEICPLRMTVLDMGENGVFTRDEFLTITEENMMEMITPSEIAEVVVEELLGVATGHNVLAAMSGSLLGPGYRAGIERMKAEQKLEHLAADHQPCNNVTAPSIALGKLGPPQFSKILFEANLLQEMYGSKAKLMAADPQKGARAFVEISVQLEKEQESFSSIKQGRIKSVMHVAPSVGVPILLEGDILLRGQNISVPDVPGHSAIIPCPQNEELDAIAALGWVDLRASNIRAWQDRVQRFKQLHGMKEEGDDTPIIPYEMATFVLSNELNGHRDFYVPTTQPMVE